LDFAQKTQLLHFLHISLSKDGVLEIRKNITFFLRNRNGRLSLNDLIFGCFPSRESNGMKNLGTPIPHKEKLISLLVWYIAEIFAIEKI